MEYYILRSFVTVAKEGSLSRAAAKLFISQPSVSTHIKALEESLGVTLFQRSAKGMKLTLEGKILLDKADRAIKSMESLFELAKTLQANLKGVVRIGLNTDPHFLRTTAFLPYMKKKYPELRFYLLQGLTTSMVLSLKEEELEAGFMFRERHGEIQTFALTTSKLFLVGPAKWKDKIIEAKLKDLAELPWIWTPEGSPYHEKVSEFFGREGLTPNIVGFADNEDTLKAMVVSGTGLSVMRGEEARQAESLGEIVIWPGDDIEPMEITLYLAIKRSRRHDPIIQAVLDGVGQVWDKSLLPSG